MHIWLLVTLRHTGQGLPRTLGPLLCLIAAASLSASLRWNALYDVFLFSHALELLVIGLAMAFWLLLLAQICPPFAAAFALVAIAADLLTMLLVGLGVYVEWARPLIVFVESIALARIATVLYFKSGTEHRE